MNLKVDKSFGDSFSSLGMSIAFCTLMVSIGKFMSSFYFYYIIGFLVGVLIAFSFVKKPQPLKKVKKDTLDAACKTEGLFKKALRRRFTRKSKKIRRTSSLGDLTSFSKTRESEVEQDSQVHQRQRGMRRTSSLTDLQSFGIVVKLGSF